MIKDYSPIIEINALRQSLSFFAYNQELVFLCIGTDLVGGDCFGPLVGQMLIESNIPYYVYGSLTNPITALNVDMVSDFVRFKHPFAAIVAVDCCIGDKSECGKIKIKLGSIFPALALNKRLKPVGDISITAVVSCHKPSSPEFLLKGLGDIYPLAKQTANAIDKTIQQLRFYNKARNFAINASQNHIKF